MDPLAHRQCILSEAELRERVADEGTPLGRYLYQEIRHVLEEPAPGTGRGEMYPIGDQPLVLLTMLQDMRTEDGDVSSNEFVSKSTPHSTDAGTYADQHGARTMRVYTTLDYRLMFEDFFMKLRELAAWQRTAGNGC